MGAIIEEDNKVSLLLETLIDVGTEEFVSGGRMKLANFIVLEIQTIDRGEPRRSSKAAMGGV